MGIDNLNVFLRENGVNAFGETSLSEFRDKRIVIDASFIFCTWLSQAIKYAVTDVDFQRPTAPMRKLMSSIQQSAKRFLFDLLQERVYPVFIHDGEAPEAKRNTLEKRRSEKTKRTEKYHILLRTYQASESLSRSSQLHALRNAYMTSNFLSGEEYNSLFTAAFSFGAPHATVLNGVDGERLAATLVREGYAAAVWTTDTDVLVHGAHTVITGFVTSSTVKVTRRQPIMEFFGNNEVYFRDFCILLGCDYNEHIPGIGSKRAFMLFSQYQGNIDAIAYNYQTHTLNIDVCRHLFSYVSSSDLVDNSKISLSFDLTKLPSHLHALVSS